MKTLIGVIIAVVFLFLGAGTVAAHELSNIEVRCEAKTIHVEGIKFGENLPIVITVTGPDYSESFEVTTDDWRHNFPLGPNGSYQVDWPNSGDFGPVPFTVDCAAPTPRPTPSVSGHTPRPSIVPRPTPPQTDTTTVSSEPLFGWEVIPVVFLILIAITGIVEGYMKRRARR